MAAGARGRNSIERHICIVKFFIVKKRMNEVLLLVKNIHRFIPRAPGSLKQVHSVYILTTPEKKLSENNMGKGENAGEINPYSF